MENSVPKFWRWVFSIELPLVLGTVVYWVGYGDVFVSEIYGKKIEGIEYFLLQQYSVVIFSYLVWFYGRLIFSESLRITEFTYFQEAALIGDIYLVASAIYYQHLFKSPITMWLQAGMALFWGIIRIFFLFSVSLKLGVYNSKSLGDTKKTT